MVCITDTTTKKNLSTFAAEGISDRRVFCEALEATIQIPNAQVNCLFKICPKFAYKRQEEFDAALRKYGYCRHGTTATNATRVWSPVMDQSRYDVFESAHLMVCAREEQLEQAPFPCFVTLYNIQCLLSKR